MTPPDTPYPYDRVPPPAPPRTGAARATSTTSAGGQTRAEVQAAKAGSKPPVGMAAKPKKRVSRRRIWLRRAMVLTVVLVLVLVGTGVYLYFWIGKPHQIQVKGLQNTPKGQENILLVGSTTRCGLKKQNPKFGTCAEGVTGVNSDIVMIAHLNLTQGKASLLSIPRDLFVPNARAEGANKIDAGLYEGPSQLTRAVEEDFGIPINHYVVLNFDTFASVVNDLGGVWMYFPDPVFDAYSGLNIKKVGCQHLDGFEALQVVRARHLQYQPKGQKNNFGHGTWPQEPLSDIARIQRTHEFLRVLAKQEQATGLSNPVTDASLLKDVISSLTVDQNFSEHNMLDLALEYAGGNVLGSPQYTYPIVTVQSPSIDGYLYQGYYYGDIEFPVQPGGYESINKLFGVSSGSNTFTDKPFPTFSAIKVAVKNGTSNTAEAGVVAAKLSARGFHVTGTGSLTPVDPTENETVVWYGGPPPPNHANWKSKGLIAAEAVMEQLEGPVILGYNPAMVPAGDRVMVEVGNDLTLAPKASTTTSTSSSTTTTQKVTTTSQGSNVTTTTKPVTTVTVADPPGVQTDPALSPPTQLTSPLAWYDPLSCNAAHDGPGSY